MRRRAAVCIGVDRTIGLPVLGDAARGARQVGDWLTTEGFESVEVLADDGASEVTLHDVKRAMRAVVDRGVFEQLVIYFAGHGFLRGYNEYWLLSAAPRDADEAVNLASSIELARGCGVPHVIFISDACRSAAASLDAQRVNGGVIFPNDGDASRGEIDRFWAAQPGSAALEVLVDQRTGDYRALYTNTLLDLFAATPPKAIRRIADGQHTLAVLPNRGLRKLLPSAMVASSLRAGISRIQTPDAVIESGDDAYIGLAHVRDGQTVVAESLIESLLPTSEILLSDLLEPTRSLFRPSFVPSFSDRSCSTEGAVVARVTHPTRRLPHIACGFHSVDIPIAECVGIGCTTRVVAKNTIVVSKLEGHSVASVVVRFGGDNGGRGAILAALDGYAGFVRLAHGLLYRVDYEPARGGEPNPRSPSPPLTEAAGLHDLDLRDLRDMAQALLTRGVLAFPRDEVAAIASRIHRSEPVDPTLGLYAAVAFATTGDRAEVSAMAEFLRKSLGGTFFDVAMLAREPLSPQTPGVAPLAPMLSPTWELMAAHSGVVLLPVLQEVALDRVMESPWTLFSPEATTRLLTAARTKELA